MTITFTICSNNFLGQARTMLQSLGQHHPEMKTYIFLVDEFHESIDYSFFSPAEIVLTNEKVVPGFPEMAARYTVMELNSAVRPFIFQYLSGLYPQVNRLYYLDPDMYVYDRLDHLDQLLEKNDILITPHFLEPIPIDGCTPFENLAHIYGVYNLGFLAMNPATAEVKRFLNWWGERTKRFGQIDPVNGFFVDQIWFNLVPVFFKRVHILAHKGYNMAIWNLHERKIQSYEADGKLILAGGENLVIYHFSNWNFFKPRELSRNLNRYSFENRSDLGKLYNDYYERLKINRLEEFSKIPCRLPVKKARRYSRVKKILMPGVSLIRKVWQKI